MVGPGPDVLPSVSSHRPLAKVCADIWPRLAGISGYFSPHVKICAVLTFNG